MTKKRLWAPRTGDTFDGWRLIEKIDEGGNGEVWKAEDTDNGLCAIKFLKKTDKLSYDRFRAEVSFLSSADVPGIVPLIAQGTHSTDNSNTPWYVMPLAEPSSRFLAAGSAEVVVRHFIVLADTLAELHARKIWHRDIKPTNILALNGRLCLSDFGLVKYPKRPELTPDRRDVGAKFTMAPEMRRHANKADGERADVYSFAKSLWISLTDNELGFDGQYSVSSSVSLKSRSKKCSGLYTTILDELLIECTENEPTNRPSMKQVRTRLQEWLATIEDFDKQNSLEWEELLSRLFPVIIPKRAEWRDLDSILAVLNEVGKLPALNHMFYPDGGGNTISSARRAAEEGFIELRALSICLLKPRKLTFESFGLAAEWNYLRLEAEAVDPILDHEPRPHRYSEYLTELEPGRYDSRDRWHYRGELGYEDLPSTARPVCRFMGGSFVIFSTSSTYNHNPATYDARHEKMGEEKFRAYIENNASR